MSVSRSSELRRKESWAGLLAAPFFFFFGTDLFGNTEPGKEQRDPGQGADVLNVKERNPRSPNPQQISSSIHKKHPHGNLGLLLSPPRGGQAPGVTRVVAEPVGMAQILECRLQEGEKRFAIGHRRRQENQGLNKSKALAAR